MPYTATKTLFTDTDADVPQKINQDLLAGQVKDEDCPWVEIGNLYVSITIIGENSWIPLIKRLYDTSKQYSQLRRDHTKYAVFTGRHGNVPNAVDNQTGKTMGAFDARHCEEDEKIKKKAEAEFPGISIELVDTAQGEKNHSEWLKKETSKRIFQRHIVIYAWCYGLFSMCEGSSDAHAVLLPKAKGDRRHDDERRIVWNSHQQHLISTTIAALCKDYWNWVPRPIM